MEPLIIGKETIARQLSMRDCISLMENAFRSLAQNHCLQPLRSLMWLPDKTGLLGMMPCYADELGVMGIKVLSVFPQNKEFGYPSHQGMVILFDAKNGQPLCMADADEITAIRTAAASAVATRLLARKDATTLAILGSGLQAARHVEAMVLVRDIQAIRIWSRNSINATQFAKEISKLYSHIDVVVAIDPAEALKGSDIVCTVTASRTPIVTPEWVAPGTHINAVGASSPAARELDTATIVKSKLFTDRYESIFKESGDFLIPRSEGAIDESHVKAEIGELLLGTKDGRTDPEEITIFKSLGLAIEDIYAVHFIYQQLLAAR